MKSLSCFLIKTILCSGTAFFSQAQGCFSTNPLQNRESISDREKLSNKQMLSNNELFEICLAGNLDANPPTTEKSGSPTGDLSENQVTWSGRTNDNFFHGDNWIGKRKEPNRQDVPNKSGSAGRNESSSRESNAHLDKAARDQNQETNKNQLYQGKLPNENERALFGSKGSKKKIMIEKGTNEPYKIGGFEFSGGQDYSFDVKNQTIAFQEIGVKNPNQDDLKEIRTTSATQTFNLSDNAGIIFEGSSHADSEKSETVNYRLENSTLIFKDHSHADCAKIKSNSNGTVIQFHDNASADRAEFVLIGKEDRLEFGKDPKEGENLPQSSASLCSATVELGAGTLCFKGNSRVGEPPKEKPEPSNPNSSSNSSSSDREERDQKRLGNRGQATENLAGREKKLDDNKSDSKFRKDSSNIIRKDSSKITSDSNQATQDVAYQIKAGTGTVKFLGTSHADSVKINAMNGTVHFGEQSEADNATIVVKKDEEGSVKFDGSASAGNSTITLEKHGKIDFGGYSTIDMATINVGSGTIKVNNGKAPANNKDNPLNSVENHETSSRNSDTQISESQTNAPSVKIAGSSSLTNRENDASEKGGTINVENGTAEFLENSRVGWTTINQNNGKIIFKKNSKADNATINGSVTFEDGSASQATININGEKGIVAFQKNSQADAAEINVAEGKVIFEESSNAKQAVITIKEKGKLEFQGKSNAGASEEGEERTKITAEDGIIQFTASSRAGRAEIYSKQGTLVFDGTSNLSAEERKAFEEEKKCICTADNARIHGTATFKRASAGNSHIFLYPGNSITFEAESTAEWANISPPEKDSTTEVAKSSTASTQNDMKMAEVNFNAGSRADNVKIDGISVTFNNAEADYATINLREGNNVKFEGGSFAKAVTITVGAGGNLTLSHRSWAGKTTTINKKSTIKVEEKGKITFEGQSRAGNAKITNNGDSPVYNNEELTEKKATIENFGSLCFKDGSSAHEATIEGSVAFKGASDEKMATAANATITLMNNSQKVIFGDYATAGTAKIEGGAGKVIFIGNSNAGDANWCDIVSDTSQAYVPRDNAVIEVTTGSIQFRDNSHAGNAALKVTDSGGYILFEGGNTETGNDKIQGSKAEKATITSSVKPDRTEPKPNKSNSSVRFLGQAEGGKATITAEEGAYIYFGGDSNAKGATINVKKGILLFDGESKAGNAVINLDPPEKEQGENKEKGVSKLIFEGNASAEKATINVNTSNCEVIFTGYSKAGSTGTTANSATISAEEGTVIFSGNSNAQGATINVSGKAKLKFEEQAAGDQAKVFLKGDAMLSLGLNTNKIEFGQLKVAEGATGVTIDLGKSKLKIGTKDEDNHLEGHLKGEKDSELIKAGKGQLVLVNENDGFLGTVKIEKGEMLLKNRLTGNIDLSEGTKLSFQSQQKNRDELTINSTGATILFTDNANAGKATITANKSQLTFEEGTSGIKATINLKSSSTPTIESNNEFGLPTSDDKSKDSTLTIKSNNEFGSLSSDDKSTNLNSSSVPTIESNNEFGLPASDDKSKDSTLTIKSNNEFGSLSSDDKSTIFIGKYQLTVGREIGKEGAEIAGKIVGEKKSEFIKVGKGTLRLNGNQDKFEGTLQLNNGTIVLEKGLAGDLTCKGGNIRLTVDDLKKNSPIQIGGKVDIKQGKVELVGLSENDCLGEDYHIRESYAILEGKGGIENKFTDNSLIHSNDIWLKQTFHKEKAEEGKILYMTLLPDLSLASQSKNQKNVAAQLDNVTTRELKNTPFLEELINTLVTCERKEVCSALNQLSGEQYATLLLANQKATERFLRNLYTPLRFITMDQDCEELSYNQYKCWGNLGGGNNNQESTQKAKGYEMNELVLALGVQRSLNYTLTECETLREMIPSYWLTGWTMGLAMNYGNQHFDFKKGESKAHSEAHHLEGAFYALFTKSSYYFLVDVVIGYWTGELERSIHFYDRKKTKAHGHPHLFQTTFYGELGFNNYSYCNIVIQPYLGLETGYYNLSEIKEKRGEEFNLKIDSHGTPITNTCLGVHLFKLYDNDCSWGLSADLAWKHLFHFDEELHAHLASLKKEFKVEGPNEDHNGFEGALTLFKALNKRWTISVELAGERWANYSNLYFTANLSYKW